MSTAEAKARSGGDGGGAARRAVVRWALRMFRREWRQQALVLSLLTLAVAAAVGVGTAGYNLAPVPGNAEFGSANHFLRFDQPEPLIADVTAVEEWFGTIDVIGHQSVSVPGRFEPVDYRVQDPTGAYSAPLLVLLEGRYPAAGAELAATEGVAEEFSVGIGAPLGLDGVERTVVGIVENPSDLHDEFVLLAPTADVELGSITILVDADEDRVLSFRSPGGGDRVTGSRGGANEAVVVAVGLLGVTTVALLLVGLLASGGFMVIAQRRRRQLGMLAAIGATERRLRLALVANGAAVGVVAALVGSAVGVVGWMAAQPRLEAAVGYRLARFDLPWWLIGVVMLLAVLAATGAAWWPARVVSRGSIVGALSGRPERPATVRRSATLAGILIAGGVAALFAAGPVADDQAVYWRNVGLIVGGTVTVIVGVLLAAPVGIRAVASWAGVLRIGPRIALRDLARYQARSAAALAAITLALGIPIAIVVAATAAQHTAQAGNLADNQLLIRGDFDGPFVPEPAQLDPMRSQVDRIAAILDRAVVTELDVALDPGFEYEATSDGRVAVTLAEQMGDGWVDLSLLYVATPKLLGPYGVDLDTLDPATDFISVEFGELGILGVAQEPDASARKVEPVTTAEIIEQRYTSAPGTFVTPEALRRRGWLTAPSGRWLIESDGPLTVDELATTRDLAAGAGLTIETRDHQAGLAGLRTGATAVGMVLAFGVLAMTVGLIRGEAAGDLRILTATGATSTARRAVTATTAGALAALGVTLGGAAAFLVLGAGYLDDVGALARLPGLHLLLIVIGTPCAAALGGWLLAGREPPMMSRQPIG